ncbi:hypothetical protein BT96DRAFT_987663 [Gymnopus androsaceus JB14]|uniref:Uncharacterized protein n=1 Tax=Gymnopus androsaceus JB14 TaxID=1447944 RepID=A0A6A4IAA1_9AGAR|nr:hypothetical protein BT96DRAFT_987663 [Gymnopus androsaceus JB14]
MRVQFGNETIDSKYLSEPTEPSKLPSDMGDSPKGNDIVSIWLTQTSSALWTRPITRALLQSKQRHTLTVVERCTTRISIIFQSIRLEQGEADAGREYRILYRDHNGRKTRKTNWRKKNRGHSSIIAESPHGDLAHTEAF